MTTNIPMNISEKTPPRPQPTWLSGRQTRRYWSFMCQAIRSERISRTSPFTRDPFWWNRTSDEMDELRGWTLESWTFGKKTLRETASTCGYWLIKYVEMPLDSDVWTKILCWGSMLKSMGVIFGEISAFVLNSKHIQKSCPEATTKLLKVICCNGTGIMFFSLTHVSWGSTMFLGFFGGYVCPILRASSCATI